MSMKEQILEYCSTRYCEVTAKEIVSALYPGKHQSFVMNFKYNVNDCYFLSNLDNELYRIDFNYTNKRAYAIKLTGLLSHF